MGDFFRQGTQNGLWTKKAFFLNDCNLLVKKFQHKDWPVNELECFSVLFSVLFVVHGQGSTKLMNNLESFDSFSWIMSLTIVSNVVGNRISNRVGSIECRFQIAKF